MFKLSLTACSFLLKESHSQDKFHYLNEKITIEKDDHVSEYTIKDMLISFFKKYTESADDTDKQKTFHCEFDNKYQGETEDFFYVYTIIKSGSYGSASDIVDNPTKKVVYKIKANQTAEKPFYLYIIIPKDNKNVKVQKGMLFFQNVGPFGVKTITTDYMKEFFSNEFNITLICKTIATKLFVERMLTKDKVLKLIMTKNHKSDDPADNIYRGYGSETKVLGHLQFSDNAWNRIKSKINNFSQGRFNLFEFDQVQYDTLKLNVDIGGRNRIVNMHNLENLSLIEAISDEIMAADGHAKKDLLLAHFEKVAGEYLKDMVLQVN